MEFALDPDTVDNGEIRPLRESGLATLSCVVEDDSKLHFWPFNKFASISRLYEGSSVPRAWGTRPPLP